MKRLQINHDDTKRWHGQVMKPLSMASFCSVVVNLLTPHSPSKMSS